jgi:hypothetical protein
MGKITALNYSGFYTFCTLSDDGVRLAVNGKYIINNWSNPAPTENCGSILFSANQSYNIVLSMFENGGGAVIKLYWSNPQLAKQIIPSTQLIPATVAIPLLPTTPPRPTLPPEER